MALPLNVFRTATANITTSTTTVYTAPSSPGRYTAIALMAQISNVTTSAATVTVLYTTPGGGNTELLKDFSIPGNDAASALVGKMVIETDCSIRVSASVNGALKITLSVLETANE
jgi:hypothetical protein